MAAAEQVCYTLISASAVSDLPNESQLIKCLEEGNTEVKIHTLKQVIRLILNGEKFRRILMPIIRFVLPLQDHTIKRLLQIFWEIVPKTKADGQLLEEMILVCDYFRKDLLHPNKYVCGLTLRLLCKLKEPELLEPLTSPIRKCLECHHPYVRRNAVLAVFTIYKNFDFLIPDAPEVIFEFLKTEVDMSCKRNAFIILMHVNQERALNYLNSCIDQVCTFEASLQLVILEFIYRTCHVNPVMESHLMHCLYDLLNSSNLAVRYEAAGALVALSNSPVAIKAAASCYIELIAKGNDNNVRLIVLNRLTELRDRPECVRVMQDLVMDILQVLVASNLEVQQKILSLGQDLVSSRNVADVMLALKKEVIKTCTIVNSEDTIKYRQLLVHTLRSCIKFPAPENTVIIELLAFLPDFDEQTAVDVLACIQEAMQKFEHLGSTTVNKLLEIFSFIMSSKVHRSTLWILGEYCCTVEHIHMAMKEFCQCIGNIPIVDELRKAIITEETASDSVITPVQKLIMADGTYAGQSIFCTGITGDNSKQRTPLRDYLVNGDYFVGAALSSTLVKLALRYVRLVPDPKKQNLFIAKSMLIMASVIHLGKSGLTLKDINDDDLERISLCLKVLASHCPVTEGIFGVECHKSLVAMLASQVDEPKNQEKEKVTSQVDDTITFGQLTHNSISKTQDTCEMSLTEAQNIIEKMSETSLMSAKLNKVLQLTGFSDPVYVEVYVYINHDNILLDILILNQTSDTLLDCNLELTSCRSLKFFEKPPPFILAPNDFCNIKARANVLSSKGGTIFGNMTYKGNSSTTEICIVLNDLQIDVIKTTIVPAICGEQDFLKMWKELAWENKVCVNTHFRDLNECVELVALSTNTKFLSQEKMSGECGFVCANLYGCSVFGERVACNVSIEKNLLMPDSPVTGHVCIRSDCRDLILILGGKLNSLAQKEIKMESGG